MGFWANPVPIYAAKESVDRGSGAREDLATTSHEDESLMDRSRCTLDEPVSERLGRALRGLRCALVSFWMTRVDGLP